MATGNNNAYVSQEQLAYLVHGGTRKVWGRPLLHSVCCGAVVCMIQCSPAAQPPARVHRDGQGEGALGLIWTWGGSWSMTCFAVPAV